MPAPPAFGGVPERFTTAPGVAFTGDILRHAATVAMLALLLATGLHAAAAPDAPAPGQAAPAPATAASAHDALPDVVVVHITTTQFAPAVVAVPAGTTVRWEYAPGDPAGLFHTVTSGNPATGAADGRFRSGLLAPGDSFAVTFTEAGETVTYFCEPHRAMGMWGAVVVLPANPHDDAPDAPEPPDAEDPGEGTAPPAPPQLPPAPDPPGDPDDGDGDDGEGANGDDGAGGGGEAGAESDGGDAEADGGDGDDGSNDTAEAASGGEVHVVHALDHRFEPEHITIRTGDTVRWVNEGDAPHTATHTDDDPAFDSGNLPPGATFEFTFTENGTYPYECVYHAPLMTGTVAVEGPPVASTTTGANNATSANDENATTGAEGAADNDTADPASSSDDDGAGDTTNDGGNASAGHDNGDPGGAPTAGTDAPTVVTVRVLDHRFEPAHVTVAPGTVVRWVNDGRAPHTVTADDGAGAGGFDSGNLPPGATFEHTFQAAGATAYHCMYHLPNMRGSITVEDPDAGGANDPGAEGNATGAPANDTATEAPARGTRDDAAGDDDSGAENGAEAPTAVVVRVLDNRFEPATVHVEVGDTIEWVLEGDAPHTVTAEEGAGPDSGHLAPGDRFRYTVTGRGVIPYACLYHPGMAGRIAVGTDPAAAGDNATGEAPDPHGGQENGTGVGAGRSATAETATPGPGAAATFAATAAAAAAGTRRAVVSRKELTRPPPVAHRAETPTEAHEPCPQRDEPP